MEKMTVYELQSFLKQHRPRQVVFLSDNQPWDSIGLPLRLHLSFPVILTALNPNAILLKNGVNTLSMNNVTNVEKCDGPAGFGTVLNIFCRNYADGADEVCYTLILK